MVLGAKPGTAVVAPARRDCRFVEGVAWLALGDPEVRLAPPPESRRRDAGFHDQLVAQWGEGFLVEALAALEVLHGNTYVIQHRSHLPRPSGDRTNNICQPDYPRSPPLRNGDLPRPHILSHLGEAPARSASTAF